MAGWDRDELRLDVWSMCRVVPEADELELLIDLLEHGQSETEASGEEWTGNHISVVTSSWAEWIRRPEGRIPIILELLN